MSFISSLKDTGAPRRAPLSRARGAVPPLPKTELAKGSLRSENISQKSKATTLPKHKLNWFI